MTILYIGSYVDVSPLKLFAPLGVSKFVYVDQCPGDALNYFAWQNPKRNMLKKFQSNMRQMGFQVTTLLQQSIWTFHLQHLQYGQVIVSYHTNTMFPEQASDQLKEEMKQCSVLYIRGFWPCYNKVVEWSPIKLIFVQTSALNSFYLQLSREIDGKTKEQVLAKTRFVCDHQLIRIPWPYKDDLDMVAHELANQSII